MTDKTKRKRGRPLGTPQKGVYGIGVKTKVVRVPEAIANNIPEILAKFEQIKGFVDEWDKEIEKSALKSSVGKPSPRYDKAMIMLTELRRFLGD